MGENVYRILKERGFIYQTTDDQVLEKLLSEKRVTCYIGFDATADSLHVGSLVQIMGLVHMERFGHRPIALIGGGTTMVGDPSGKTEMRKMLGLDDILAFGQRIKDQLGRFLSIREGKTLCLNNAEWLVGLKYIDFLRDIGRHFSVNRMLTAETYKMRLETGLSFIEFNYMLLQSYDFYILARDHGCELQMGGQDQWGNIVAGADLVRRLLNKTVYGMTTPLLMSAAGEKFGKTAAGAVWLDTAKTSPHDFYQFWRNVADSDVEKCLGLFTFLPMDEVRRLSLKDTSAAEYSKIINRAKEILAYEVTCLVHGKAVADSICSAFLAKFGASDPGNTVPTSSAIASIVVDSQAALPTVELSQKLLESGIWVVKLFVEAGLCSSNSEVRRLIQQGGASINGKAVADENLTVTTSDLDEGSLLVRAGKKRFKRIIFK